MNDYSPTDAVYLSVRDERANVVTHGLGFLLSLVAAVVLFMHPQLSTWGERISAAVFALSMAGVYFCSTMSHLVNEPRRRNRWRAWDQGVIYALIAGTYTPFIYMGSPQGWTGIVLGAVWLSAIGGFISKVIVRHRVNGISTVTYVLLGWLPAIPLVARTPRECLIWMVAGGAAYTAGLVFLMRDKHVTYFHAMWHLMVMLGSTLHFVAVYRLPYLAQ